MSTGDTLPDGSCCMKANGHEHEHERERLNSQKTVDLCYWLMARFS